MKTLSDILKLEPASDAEYDTDFLLKLYEEMVKIRVFEDQVKMLFLEGNMPGTIHQCQGQEATAVGVCQALGPDDMLTSTHRPHGHALAKGLTTDEMMAELYGKITGCCKGKGGSMHVGDMDKGMVPAIAIVAGGIPLACGIALSFKLRKEKRVAACFFGDGAINEGAFHEAANMAAIWDLPIVLVCENNLYGASTAISDMIKLDCIADRAPAYGIRGETVDGNDVIKVLEATKTAVDECRRGDGPVLLELLTYRRTGHSRRDPCNYQEKSEKEAWFEHDPIEVCRKRLTDRDVGDDVIAAIDEKIEQMVLISIERAQNAPEPQPEELETDVLAP